ncbi:MAG: hypothetical protein OXC68_13865, partial [Aestuariivita sp.]|nr:hypothetical protein [Aestuariivita sp.]
MGDSFRVAADIGETFTDIVYQDTETGRCGATKVLSTPDNPALAVLKGIDQVLGEDGNLAFFVHGTTVGLNALLTRKGSKVALVTNENFRDIYTIQGNNRGEIFSIQWNKPEPLASLEHTFTVGGRIAASGDELEPVRLADLDQVVDACSREQYDAIAISLLFSFNNSAHEITVRDYLAARLPNVQLVMSHEVSPEWREFERTSTTVTDAYLAPVVRKYISTLQDEMSDRLPAGGTLHVMESNGGVMTASTATE